ncbi:MAG TPA: alpha/beta fold hydrolase [Micromonosporaceae bacterium]|jgi:pimeloyl-ACP methyl ester carboxylesterase
MIQIENGEVWADDSGGDGPTLVLLHPGIGDSRVWDPILPALTPSYRVIRYDARGFGQSPAPTAEFTLLDDLIAVVDQFAVERAAFVGCSQGGDTSLAFALAQPSRVSALVLLCPGISGYPIEDPEMDAVWESAEAAGVESVDEVAALGLQLWGRAGATPEVAAQFHSAARAWLSNEGFEKQFPPVYDRLGEISVPSSLLVGDLDRPALIESNRAAAARIPGCELVDVAGVDHLPPLRVPDLVLDLIQKTLAR